MPDNEADRTIDRAKHHVFHWKRLSPRIDGQIWHLPEVVADRIFPAALSPPRPSSLSLSRVSTYAAMSRQLQAIHDKRESVLARSNFVAEAAKRPELIDALLNDAQLDVVESLPISAWRERRTGHRMQSALFGTDKQVHVLFVGTERRDPAAIQVSIRKQAQLKQKVR
jgi:hypothetical protein